MKESGSASPKASIPSTLEITMSIQTNSLIGTAIANLSSSGRKTSAVVAIALSGLGLLSPAAFALSQRELYHLCSRYPRNSNCTDYEVPVALADREGTVGECKLYIEEKSTKGRCKVDITEDSVVAYIETGSKLSLLEGEQATKTVEIEATTISDLSYVTDLAPLNATELNVARFLQVVGMGMQLAGGGVPSSYSIDSSNPTASQLTVQFGSYSANEDRIETQLAEKTPNNATSVAPDNVPVLEETSIQEETNIQSEEGNLLEPDASINTQTVASHRLSFKSSPQRERQIRESIQRMTGLVPYFQMEEESNGQ